MKTVLGVSGSPRVDGNSDWLLKTTLNAFPPADVQTDLVLLSKANLQFCNGCLLCEDNHICSITDDMDRIATRMLRANMIVFSTPAYFDGIPGLLKNLIDRTNIIADKLAGKSAAIIVVGQADETSWARVADYLRAYCDIVKMRTVGTLFVKARQKAEAAKIDGMEQKCQQFAQSLLLTLDEELPP